MTEASIQKGSALESARSKLERSVARLEAAIDARAGDLSASVSAETAASLETLRSENAALRDVAMTIGRRLDKTIGRLRGALGE
ncbi:MAG: hypothetical protein OQJ99_04345 [Rhodospirillales bacterium]|nr:hypothetical protein [Rhodospirillales bacterium]MCW8861944.1 hypothetical protein [Rhodospirillales bacterium]MCW8952855.1 hypothetical protein [Rhodospirillales bacterium]MCW8970344.1 hypothetical protein [Rhodospirillales bacterium]MCW9003077.1 hypothetical protein [Rhodospirillales bacterium]